MMTPAEIAALRAEMNERLDNMVQEEVIDMLVGATIIQQSMVSTIKELGTKLAEVRKLAQQYKNETDQSSWVSERLFEILDGDG